MLAVGMAGSSARPGYDLASGLGVPQFAQIATVVPHFEP
jgi:hypothetical protein